MKRSMSFALKRFGRELTAYVSSGAIVVTSVLPVYADVVATPDGAGGTLTDTVISVSGNTSTVTTGTISGGVGLNAFNEFSIDSGKTVELVQPDGTNALVNVVNDASGTPSSVLGTLNISKAGDADGVNSSKVFIVDHNGFVVGSTGTINANTLVLSTAKASVGSQLIAGDSDAMSDLMAGSEELDPDADIRFLAGSNVNVSALELHVGAELILNGTVTVDAPGQEGSSVPVAVNSSHLTQAKGASVQGGVIHFGAKNASIGGTVRAKRGAQGGQISGRVSGSLAVTSGATLDVSGVSFDGGSILFGGDQATDFVATSDSALTFSAGATIDASSDTGTGGFFFARGGSLNFGGTLNLMGGGAALLEARTSTTFTGATTTNGGDIAALSDAIIVAPGGSIDTTSGSIAGDISLIGTDITIGSGAILNADVAGTNTGGLVALLATERASEVGFPVSDDGATAQIALNNANVDGGAVVISAFARTANLVDATNAASVESQTSDAESNDGVFTDAFNDLTSRISELATKGRELFSKKLPIQFKDIDATAAISITNSTIDARGNWKGVGGPAAAAGLIADNGILRKTGLQTRDYTALLGKPLTAMTQLPNAFNATTDSLYIHANAETEIDIKPASFLLSTATSITDTKSTVRVENSDLTATSGDVVLNSSVQDTLSIDILGSGVKGVAVATIVATHNSVNQLLVLDGSVTANAGDIRAAALTGKAHELSNRVGAGDGGTAAVAVTVSMGSSFTEAALGGTLSAQNLDLDAETLYFQKSHETQASLGDASNVSDAVPTSAAGLAAKLGAERLKQSLNNGDDEDPTKNKLGIGLAVDIQLDTNRTLASLGGTYRDLTAGSTDLQMAPATVTIGSAVTVDATQRFGRFDEGGEVVTRKVRASMQDLSSALRRIRQQAGMSAAPDLGTDVALFGTLSMSQMSGATRAEIGSGAVVNAGSVVVDALTEYQTVSNLLNFRDRWRFFTNELTKIDATGTLIGNPSSVPDLDAATDGIVFVTTSVGIKSGQGSDVTGDQKFAMGVSVNLFETDNDTIARIGDNASITTSGDVVVTAKQEALFTHLSASSGGAAKLLPNGASNLVGAHVSVPRMLSTVIAEVGDATVNAGGDLNILAENDVIQLGVAKSGGSAAKAAINGAVAANIFETTTVARLGEQARVNVQDIRIEAVDSSMLVSIAGATASGVNLGFGASAVINLIKRDTRAEIGNSDVVSLAAAGGRRIDARTLNIYAANTGIIFGSALAGTKVAGSAAGSAAAGAQDNDQQLAAPAALLSNDENAAVAAQNNTQSAPDATGASRASGFAISGSVVLNLFQKNDVTAGINTRTTIAAANSVTVLAENTARDAALAGSVAIGLGLDLSANALAGAVAVKKDTRNTRSIFRGATITGLTVSADARDAARSVTVAVSGSGGKSTLAALAGSVSTNIEAGETLVLVQGATVTTTVSQTFIARNQGQQFGIAGGVSASVGGQLGIGFGVATNDSSRDAKLFETGSTLTSPSVSMRSLSELEVYGIAASGGLARLSLGGSAVANTVSGSAITRLDGTRIVGGNVVIDARSGNELWAYTGNLSVAAKAAIGGAVSTNLHDGGAQAIVSDADITGDDISVTAGAQADLTARALALSTAATGAVGIGIAVNKTGMTVLADIDSSDLLARGNITVSSNAVANVSGLTFAGADGGVVAATGTATYNEANNTVETFVRDQDRTDASRLFAKGSIAVTSAADTNVVLLGGRDKLPNLNGNITAAGTAGFGASITINSTNNQVTTALLDEASVQGFGASTVGTRLGAYRGVLVDAYAVTDVDAMAISGGAAVNAALTGIFVYNTVSDDVATNVGDGLTAKINTVTGLDAALSSEISGTVDIYAALGGTDFSANAGQSVRISAAALNAIDNFALAVAVSGAAVGASGSGNLIDSTAQVIANTATVNAQSDIDVLADVTSRVTTYALGASGGKAAGSASVTYNSIKSAALVNLIGTGLSAGGAVSVTSNVDTDLTSYAGNLAVGGAAGAGAVLVNILATQSEVRTTATTVDRYNLFDTPPASGPVGEIRPTYVPGLITAGGDVTIDAKTVNVATSNAISGAVGGGFVAISSAINLMESQTGVVIAPNFAIEGDDVSISAIEQTRLSDLVGVLAGGGAGVGGSLNYVDFAGNASVIIGTEARIAAEGDLSLNAQADRDVDGMVGMASIVGGSALSAVISIINIGGKAIDESGKGGLILNQSQTALSDDPTAGQQTGSLGAMTSRSGATGAVGVLDADRQSADIAPTGARVDNVGVVIAADATLQAGGNLDLLAQSNTAIDQTVGVVSVGMAALSAAVGVTNLSSKARIDIHTGARILSDNVITIAAGTAARPNQTSIESTVYSVAASGGANASAGVSVANAKTQTDVVIAGGVRIGTVTNAGTGNAAAAGDTLDLPAKVNIKSTRADTIQTTITNFGLAGAAAVGAAYAEANNAGTANVTIGASNGSVTNIASGNVLVEASDLSRVSATTTSAQGGTLAGVSGAFALTSNTGGTAVLMARTAVNAATFALNNTSSAQAASDGTGLALGALAIGVTIAEAYFDASLTTELNAVTVDAVTIELVTEIRQDGANRNVFADALAGSGGILAGGGAVARALSNYRITTTIDGGADAVLATRLSASGQAIVRTNANNFSSQADASGVAAGAIAVGVVIGEVGQKDRSGEVLTDIRSGTITGLNGVFIGSDNSQVQGIKVVSGSGGLVSGAGAEAKTYVNGKSTTKIGDSGAVTLIAGNPLAPEESRFNGELTVLASQDTKINSFIDNTSASAVGFSGGFTTANVTSDVDVIIGSGARTIANFYTINAFNALTRAQGSNSIKSKSGGGLVGAAISSDVIATVNTDVTIKDQAELRQIGDPTFAKGFIIGSEANLRVEDRQLLDAGGLIAVPIGRSAITVNQTGSVTIGLAKIRAAGKLDIYSGANATLKAEAHSTTYGLAGTASSKTYATYNATNTVDILPGADILSFTDIALRAGQGSGGEQRVDVDAESRSFNKTAVAIEIDPVANAISNVVANVNIGAGSKVIAYQDIDLIASGGRRDVRGFGLAKDFYKEVVAAAASIVGASLVLDIETGETTNNATGTVTVNGEVRSGAFNRRVLYLDDNDVLNNGLLETARDSGVFESNADAPDPSLYLIERNVDLGLPIQARITSLEALITDPATSAADKARYSASRLVLLNRLSDLAGELSTVVTVDYLRASEGSVRIEGDVLTGSATGSLYAASEADIRIYSTSGAQLNILGLEIAEVEGGDITFNEALIAAGSPDYAFNVSFGQVVDGENLVSIITNRPLAGPPNAAALGNIDLLGTVSNFTGDVAVNTEEGSITQSAPVNSENYAATALKGSVNIGPTDGIDDRGGKPSVTYGNYVRNSEGISNVLYNIGVRNNFGRIDTSYARSSRTSTNSFAYRAPTGFTTAGRSITILAEYTNINTLLRAGTGSYKVTIGAEIDNVVAGLRASGGTGRTRLDSLASPSRNGVVRTSAISNDTNAEIYYNYETGKIEIEDMKVRGGAIYVVSNVISTGFGALEAVDGFGSLSLNSQAQTDVVINSIDLGGSANGSALEGLVRITDLSKYSNYTGGGPAPFLTTDYRSIGGVVRVYDNNAQADGSSGEETIQDAFGNNVIRPARLVSNPETSGSDFIYRPVVDRDYVAVTEKTRLLKLDQFDVSIVHGNGSTISDPRFSAWYRERKIPVSDAGVIANSENLIASAAASRPFVARSLGGSDYAYAYDHSRNTYRLAQGARYYDYVDVYGKTHRIFLNAGLHNLADQVANPFDDRTGRVNAGFERIYNIWPGDQSYYSLIYDIEPGLRSSERELNIRHKIIDMRSALFYETERHVHRFKADYGIAVRFSGSQTAGTNITANGNVILNKDIFNRFGETSITSQTGSILSATPNVEIKGANLNLSAVNGSIGGIGGPLRIDLSDDTNPDPNIVTPGRLSAVAGQGIDIFEISGDLRIDQLETTQRGTADFGAQVGGIKIKAQGNIIQTGAASAFKGSDISLDSQSGGIFREGVSGSEALLVDTEFGRLDAAAQTDITVREVAGDLGIGTVSSVTGNVTLEVPTGRALDRNNVEVRDTRTLAQLNTLWSKELALTASSVEYAERITTYQDRFTAEYQAYWAKRTANGGAGPVVFTLDPSVEAELRASGQSDADVTAYIARLQALYTQWNSEGSFDQTYTYIATAPEIADLTAAPTAYDTRIAEQISAFESRFTAEYRTYWEKRNAGGGLGNVVFALDPTVEANMRASGLGNARVDDYIAEYQALYTQWNGESNFDQNYSYTATASEIASLTEGSVWTTEDLTTSIRAGLVLETGDTNIRLENPNVIASGDITITARDGIGEIKDPYELVKPAAGSTLTARDLEVLALADKDDFDIDGDGTPDLSAAGNTLIRQEEDLNFAFTEDLNGRATGDLRLTSNFNEIYLASETAAEINKVHGSGAVELRVDGLLTNANVETFAVAGQDVLLESGALSDIGEAGGALTVNILAGGTLSARSGKNIYLDAPTAAGVAGDLPIATIFAGDHLTLTAAGAITDAIGSGLERIIAGSADITGATLGTAGTPLGVAIVDPETGAADLTSTLGEINVFSARDFALSGFSSQTGGRLATTNGAALELRGPSPISFAGNAAFQLDLDGALSFSGVTGPAITGGTLDVVSRIGFGTDPQRLTTQVANLNFAPSSSSPVAAPLSVWIANTGDLTVGTVNQTGSTVSQTGISTTGDLTLGSFGVAGELDFDAGGRIESGVIAANRLELKAAGDIGRGKALALSVNTLDIETTNGDARAALTGGDVTIERADIGGRLDLQITGGDATIGPDGIRTSGTAQITSVQDLILAAGTDLSAGRNLDLNADTIIAQDGVELAAADLVRLQAMDIAASDNLSLRSLGTTNVAASNSFNVASGFVTSSEFDTTFTAQALAFGDRSNISSENGNVTIASTVGDLSFGKRMIGRAQNGTFQLAAAQDLAIGNATRLENIDGVVISAGRDITVGTESLLDAKRDINVSSGAAVTFESYANLTAGTEAQITATSIGIGTQSTLAAAELVRLQAMDIAASDNLRLRSLGTIDVAASNTFTVANGFVSSSQFDTTFTAQALAFGDRSNISSENGNVTIASTVGDLSFGQRMIGRAQNGTFQPAAAQDLAIGSAARLEGIENIIVSAGRDIAFGQDALLKATRHLNISSGAELRFGSFATASTVSGDIDVASQTALRMEEGSQISSVSGEVRVTTGTDLVATRIETGNATAAALNVTVGGTLRATDPAQTVLVANAIGATTTLNLAQVPMTGPKGLNVQLDTLDATIQQGDLHLYEADAIKLGKVKILDGTFDLFAAGDVTIGNLAAKDAIVVSSESNLLSDAAMLDADVSYLFAFGGSIGGVAGATFRGDVTSGVLNLYARDNASYTETAGNAEFGYALTTRGDLSVTTEETDALLEIARLGAGGNLALTSRGGITLDALGGGEVDLIDETARALVFRGANPYGSVSVETPETLSLRSIGEGAKLEIGLLNAKSAVELQADIIKANLFDETPDNGVQLRVSGIDGAVAQRVDVNVIGDPQSNDVTTEGALTLSFARFETGEIATVGSALIAKDVVVTKEAWFRQKSFDLFVNASFEGIVEDADAQALAVARQGGNLIAGPIAFAMTDDRQLATDTLVINRKLEDVGLNGLRSLFEGALTELLLNLDSEAGPANETRLKLLSAYLDFLGQPERRRQSKNTLVLPLVIASR